MYSFDSRVRYSELDPDKRLGLDSLVDYLQDCSTFQSEDLGVGLDYLAAKGQAWILVYWQIIIDRLPKFGETITVGTFPYDFKSFMGMRNFFIRNGEEFLVRANSVWTLADLQNNRLVKVGPETIAHYQVEEPLEMEYEPRKVIIPEGGERMEPIVVSRQNLDSNMHVNNAQYVSMALPYLPEEFDVGQLRVEYKSQAHLGDEIHPRVVPMENGIGIVLEDSEGKAYTLLEFRERKD